MLSSVYQTLIRPYLSESQYLTLEILVWLLQTYKTCKLERLAASYPLPILYESRRKHLQRFLNSRALSVTLIWLPLIKQIITSKIPKSKRLIIALDRTHWQDNNLLMVSVIWKQRALPIYWIFIKAKGSSNLREQMAVLRPVFKLLKQYQLVIIGDREFRGVQLAYWLKRQKVQFVLRVQESSYVKIRGQESQKISDLELYPGMKQFYSRVNYTKKKGFGYFNLGAYWKRKYRGKQEKQGWYLLTNLTCIEEVIKVYQSRMGIEAMFRDCKSGGYNLEGSKVKRERLKRIVLLIAIAYTSAIFQGGKIKHKGQQKYVNRCYQSKTLTRRHSNFWVGLYGHAWIINWDSCWQLVEQLMSLSLHKLSYYQRGLRAMSLIQSAQDLVF
jgi:hypothetical protein